VVKQTASGGRLPVTLGTMRTTFVACLVLMLGVLAACSAPGLAPGASPTLLGTWAEIVTSQPANAVDGRQVVERLSDGSFKIVFVKTHPSQPPCTGRWSLSGTSYQVIFESVSCFSNGTPKPDIGKELTLELLSAEPSRLKFVVPAGAPLASWQARLEGGIE
jgi:hypothetical protein